MIRTIKEYPIRIEPSTYQSVYLPTGAQVVGIRKTTVGVNLIVLSGLVDGKELRSFQTVPSASNIFAEKVSYIGTCLDNILGTIHIIEIKS